MTTPNRIYGIDLGTTYSCIAYVDEHGKPVIVPNSEGLPTTPSVVYFETRDSIAVGRTAKDVAELHSDQVVSTVKRAMGDPDWVFMHEGRSFQPQDISSFILRRLVADAQSSTGDVITDVVITCPAYFGVTEKEATKQAGVLAGLNVRYVIPEPVAAALAYGEEQAEDQVILVYDLGGGTFDITVIKVEAKAITVVCTGGDHQLGGRNWDEVIALWFASQFAEQNGVQAEDLTNNPETWQELLNGAENAKTTLSTRERFTQKLQTEAGKALIELTRAKLDELTAHLLQRTLSMTAQLLETARDKGCAHIDKLLLVGGSTYMPQVLTAIQDAFPFPVRQYDPNQAVAKGAAIYGFKCNLEEQIRINIAGQTGGEAETVDVGAASAEVRARAERQVAETNGLPLPALLALTRKTVTNVASKSFGVEIQDARSGEKRICNLIVVNEPLPCTISRPFSTVHDHQLAVDLRCLENGDPTGPDGSIPLNDAYVEVGSTELTFTRPLPAGSPLTITFSMTPDGLLTLHGKDLTTHQEVQAELRTSAILTAEELAGRCTINKGFTVS